MGSPVRPQKDGEATLGWAVGEKHFALGLGRRRRRLYHSGPALGHTPGGREEGTILPWCLRADPSSTIFCGAKPVKDDRGLATAPTPHLLLPCQTLLINRGSPPLPSPGPALPIALPQATDNHGELTKGTFLQEAARWLRFGARLAHGQTCRKRRDTLASGGPFPQLRVQGFRSDTNTAA